jgi:hypothetical protein
MDVASENTVVMVNMAAPLRLHSRQSETRSSCGPRERRLVPWARRNLRQSDTT